MFLQPLTLSLKKRSKWTKRYHMKPIASHKEVLDIQPKECTSLINIESKDRYITKMSTELNNPKTVPKTNRPIMNNFSSNKK